MACWLGAAAILRHWLEAKAISNFKLRLWLTSRDLTRTWALSEIYPAAVFAWQGLRNMRWKMFNMSLVGPVQCGQRDRGTVITHHLSSKFPLTMPNQKCLYKLDHFHVFKVGVGRDVCGSALMWLCYLGWFDIPNESTSVPKRLERCHSWFVLWCRAEQKNPGLRSFTKLFFNYANTGSSAWCNSKGSDTMLISTLLGMDFEVKA